MSTKVRIYRYDPQDPGKAGRIKAVEVTRKRPDGSREVVAVTKTLRAAENIRDVFGRSRSRK